ncbi:TBC1 domain family member 5 [Ophiocordyceps camponoti-floridani]|uniref:TBC1 domain family member 5 n=1 Tax=Ophiocordyceps camponoti-floridani TaxID=2030778 RepID=A0A8H4VAV2_9HYPO|nr:TBC1 domain family member 5 [Ophiocordyceps camponoti-floridani]
MRSIDETLSRWKATVECGDSLADLQGAVRNNGPASPCLIGCRSVCWKTFILAVPLAELSQALQDGRREYGQRRSQLLNFIEHPEALTQLSIDPLTDDPKSPWNTLRQDETMRKEIQQDVQRLPDEANYHQDRAQAMIINILFMYCKLHPNRGGYRQGMHELLAPIVHVVEQDAIDRSGASSLDESMLVVVDSSYVEHDAYMLFSRLMEHAQVFYELREASTPSRSSRTNDGTPEQTSTIVEKSRFIHQVCLRRLDEELATHLVDMEVLPQIFLIRWIRLLFSREFPFDQVLYLWDAIFAVDPSLHLIDFICCAMLLRIRWQLLEADYATCLQLLLKYPQPTPSHGPHTFVDDAIYLQTHAYASGGQTLISKYSGRRPQSPSPSRRARTRTAGGRQHSESPRRKTYSGRSPLSSPPRFIQHQGGVESLFQGAAKSAKGVLERGEKLGLNSAVREAVGEIRRNVQMFNESRQLHRSPRADDGAAGALAAMERRNTQLAALLEETVASLKSISRSSLDDKTKSLDVIELAAAKVQFVQLYLGDSSMEMPAAEAADEGEAETKSEHSIDVAKKEGSVETGQYQSPPPPPESIDEPTANGDACARQDPKQETPAKVEGARDGSDRSGETSRPAGPMPTRSTLAQSSFSWMLEPDAPSRSPSVPSTGRQHQHRKRPSSNASRDRNAFLFGEGMADGDRGPTAQGDEIFGLEPMGKTKDRA